MVLLVDDIDLTLIIFFFKIFLSIELFCVVRTLEMQLIMPNTYTSPAKCNLDTSQLGAAAD